MRRILAIDGGGIKGVLPASFLAVMEEVIGDSVADYFDLVVGTSTGGIIALGLGIGLSAEEILQFYLSEGPAIFPGSRVLRQIRQIGFCKYSSEPLRRALEETFGDHRLGDSKCRLVIPSLNLDTGEVYVYKTAHTPHLVRDYKERMVDVALATSAAPTYFATHWSPAGTPLIDGGMWANNPVGLSVVEAVGYLNWPRDELKVLSLGCTTAPFEAGRVRKLGLGYLGWGVKAADVFMTAQSSASLGTAQILAGHENVYRISPYVNRGRFSLDGMGEVRSLRGLGDSEARKAIPKLRDVFFSQPAEPFEPCSRLPGA